MALQAISDERRAPLFISENGHSSIVSTFATPSSDFKNRSFNLDEVIDVSTTVRKANGPHATPSGAETSSTPTASDGIFRL